MILLFAVIIFSGITVAYLMHQIDELKLENDDLKKFNLSNISKFINQLPLPKGRGLMNEQ